MPAQRVIAGRGPPGRHNCCAAAKAAIPPLLAERRCCRRRRCCWRQRRRQQSYGRCCRLSRRAAATVGRPDLTRQRQPAGQSPTSPALLRSSYCQSTCLHVWIGGSSATLIAADLNCAKRGDPNKRCWHQLDGLGGQPDSASLRVIRLANAQRPCARRCLRPQLVKPCWSEGLAA